MAGNGEMIRHDGTDTGRGSIARQEFGGNQVQKSAETAATSVAARQRALVEARFLMSERHPRIWESVELKLLNHCSRPKFAEIARYCKPTGKAKNKVTGRWEDSFAEGLSARFAEVARQEMGNVEATTSVVFEDDLIRIVAAGVSDLEHNVHDSREITVAKAVEKRGKEVNGEWKAPEGREIIGHPRMNSYNEPVWLVKATDDEIRSKQNSEISKTQRDATLRLIPKDIRDGCEERILSILADPTKVDPNEQKKRIITSMAKIGVPPEELMRYHGSELDRFSPGQWNELRLVGIAIKEGELTWVEAMDAKHGTGNVQDGEPAPENPGGARVKDILAAKKTGASTTAEPLKTETKVSPETAKQPDSPPAPADTSKTAAPAASQPAHAPAGPTATQSTPADTGATLRDYDEFPEVPFEDGPKISVKGVAYQAVSGAWKKIETGPQPVEKRKRGQLDFGGDK